MSHISFNAEDPTGSPPSQDNERRREVELEATLNDPDAIREIMAALDVDESTASRMWQRFVYTVLNREVPS